MNAAIRQTSISMLNTILDSLARERSCREVSLAITKIEEAQHWLNAAVETPMMEAPTPMGLNKYMGEQERPI